MSIVLQSSGGGSVTLNEPTTASNFTQTLPAATGTVALLDGSNNFSVAGNLSFNSGFGSSAIAYGCRAWVNFNGTGTVAIRGSGNVSSITDSGVGTYRVNFTTNMPDTNFCTVVSALNNVGVSAGFSSFDSNDQSVSRTNIIFIAAPATSTTYDSAVVNVSVFR